MWLDSAGKAFRATQSDTVRKQSLKLCVLHLRHAVESFKYEASVRAVFIARGIVPLLDLLRRIFVLIPGWCSCSLFMLSVVAIL